MAILSLLFLVSQTLAVSNGTLTSYHPGIMNVDAAAVQQFTVLVLTDIAEGPLDGKFITLFMDDVAVDHFQINYFMKLTSIPIVISRMENTLASGGSGEIRRNDYNSSKDYSLTTGVDEGHVLVYLTAATDLDNLLASPPPESKAALLLIFINDNCHLQKILQSRLIQNAPHLALMCLTLSPTSPQNPYHWSPTTSTSGFFQVFTWSPFLPADGLMALGTWSSSSFRKWKDLFIDRFQSLHGVTLNLASDVVEPPYFFLDNEGNTKGANKFMIDKIAAWMDFNYTYTISASDEMWGEFVNGSWIGMLGDIFIGEKDLTVNTFSITSDRVDAFDVSVPYQYQGFGFKLLEPEPLPRWLSITYPFTTFVWGMVGLILGITALVFHLLQHSKEGLSQVESFLFISKSLMNQSSSWVPGTWILRTYVALWWFVAYIINIIFTSNLISFFTIPAYPPRVQTLEQLVYSDHKVCMLDYGEFVPEMLATSSHPLLSLLSKKLELVPLVYHLEHEGYEPCIENMLNEQYAHLEYLPFLEAFYIRLGLDWKLYSLQETIYEANSAVVFKKNTPWKYKFDEAITGFIEFGLIGKWQSEAKLEIRRLSKSYGKRKAVLSGTDDLSLSLAHLQSPFFILAFGHFISTIIMVKEFLSIHVAKHLPKAQHSAKSK